MKFIRQFLNLIIAAAFLVVASIFTYGYLNKNELTYKEKNKDHGIYQTEQSSVKDDQSLTDMYMQELQKKLKNQQIESINLIHKSPIVLKNNNIKQPVKDDDFTQSDLDQQIKSHDSRDVTQYSEGKYNPHAPTESQNQLSDFAITKDNAKEFVENARRNGFHVVLSENFEILSMTPIIKNKKLNMNDTFEVTDPH